MRHYSFQIGAVATIVAAVAYLAPIPAYGQRGTGRDTAPDVASVPTPRTADGKPDLSGYWGNLIGDSVKLSDDKSDVVTGGGLGTIEGRAKWLSLFEEDVQVNMRAQVNKPIYKPEYWAKIRETDWDYSRTQDPNANCLPSVPRLGAPQKIVQTPAEVIFFYELLNRYRIVPTDGRPHDPIKSDNPEWFGDSVAHWEGDTLVIDTIGLTEESWIGPNGEIHSADTHVMERVRRDGNTLHWETTVEDPMLLQPWHMDPITVRLNTNPKATLWEELPCEEKDRINLVDKNQGR